ncbi:MAG: hypothetical protein AMXMBFR82_29330 [Candidatus Hydrogenedentota bacterium]
MKVLREPLLHFVLVGTMLFLVYAWRGERNTATPFEIAIPAEQVQHAYWGFEQQWGRPPTEMEEEQIIDELVRNEVYYREALAMGLDKDDDAIRARLRAKLEFISQDVSALSEPSDETLREFVRERPEEFPAPPRIAFRQVYVSQDRTSEEANQRIATIREQLNSATAESPESLSDASDLPYEYPLTLMREIAEIYGKRFADRVARQEPGRWNGPIESQVGLHFVYVTERAEGGAAELEDVYNYAKIVWLDARRTELQEQAYADMREKYMVQVERPTESETVEETVAEQPAP